MRHALAGAILIFFGALSLGASDPHGVDDGKIMAAAYPKKLSDFRFFVDDAGRLPNKNVIPYALNMPLFSDYAEKFRFIYVPQGQKLLPEGEGLLRFPVGSALIKSFGYDHAGTMRLLETRIMLHRADGWVALPYVWNETQTEAVLKLAGKRIAVTFTDPRGTEQSISYAVPNKNQCKECHALSRDVTPIGPKLRNIDRASLGRLYSAKLLDVKVRSKNPLPIWKKRAQMPLESTARGYLDVNCAHCHNPLGSASNSGLFVTYEETDPIKLGIGKRPVAAGRGSGGLEFAIAPGKPEKSIMLYRMKSLDPGIAMPEVGRAVVHKEGVALLDRWIRQLPAE